jgi:hypothetical protein
MLKLHRFLATYGQEKLISNFADAGVQVVAIDFSIQLTYE